METVNQSNRAGTLPTQYVPGNRPSAQSVRQRQRRQRPSDLQTSTSEPGRTPHEANNIPSSGTTSAPLSKRSSRNSLIGFFGRTKSTKGTISAPDLQALAEEQPAPAIPTNTSATTRRAPTRSPVNSTAATSLLSPASVQTQSSKSARSQSVRSPRSVTWDPPPLFQAYPQSLKHAQLATPPLDTEYILKSQKIGNGTLSDTAGEDVTEDSSKSFNARKQEERARRHKRRLSGSLSRSDWLSKIYVLVTSGYLLQYAGDGTFDRLPEKMLRLDRSSVVFVSDAIPGSPYVLQISQTSTKDGEPVVDSKNILSRLKIRTADARREATSLLLVFESAEEMQTWLNSIRREIESLGGHIRPRSPSQPLPSPQILEHKISERYLVTREASRVSWVESADDRAKRMSFTSSDHGSSRGKSPHAHRPFPSQKNRASWAPTEAPSLSTTATSNDFESGDARDLRRSSVYTSNTLRSLHSSPPTSPVSYDFKLPDLAPFDYPEPPHKLQEQRRSSASPPQADSGNDSPSHLVRTKGTSTPNFSVPMSIQRYSYCPSSASADSEPQTTASNWRQSTSSQVRDYLEPMKSSKRISTIDELPSPTTIVSPPLARRASRLSSDFAPPVITPLSMNGIGTAYPIATPDDDMVGSDDVAGTDSQESTPFSDIAVRPKRLSSLQYAQGTLPVSPPPTIQLPSLPIDDYFGIRQEPTETNSSINHSSAPRSPRRHSVQAQSFRRPSYEENKTSTSNKRLSYQPRSSPMLVYKPSLASPEGFSAGHNAHVLPRKSMPDLMSIEPPAPPPNCPLPALPPGLLSPKEQRAKLKTRQSLNLSKSALRLPFQNFDSDNTAGDVLTQSNLKANRLPTPSERRAKSPNHPLRRTPQKLSMI